MSDSEFFIYLIPQVYKMWDKFYPYIEDVPDAQSIYLYCPYEFVPDHVMNNQSFYNKWLRINQNRTITLNRQSFDSHLPSSNLQYNDVYYTDVQYYSNGQMASFDVYHLVDDKTVGEGLYKAWYDNGNIKIIETNHIDQISNKWYQKQETWYENGNRKYIYNFVDGKEHGIQEIWTQDGKHRKYHTDSVTGDSHYITK